MTTASMKYVKSHTPTSTRLVVMFGAYCVGRFIDHLYVLGFVNGMEHNGGRKRDPADLAALKHAVDQARAELGSYRELVMAHEDVLPPTPALWQLIGWCDAETEQA